MVLDFADFINNTDNFKICLSLGLGVKHTRQWAKRTFANKDLTRATIIFFFTSKFRMPEYKE